MHTASQPGKVVVEYDEFLDDDAQGDEPQAEGDLPHLKQAELPANIRPRPPVLRAHARWAASLGKGAHCQLLYEGGWWDVVVLSTEPAGTYTVKPLLYDIEHTVEAAVLRPKVGWVWNSAAKAWRAMGVFLDDDGMETDG